MPKTKMDKLEASRARITKKISIERERLRHKEELKSLKKRKTKKKPKK